MPWLSGPPARRALGLAARGRRCWCWRRLGPWLARLCLALALFLLLFPLGLVAVASVNDSPQASVAQFLGFTWRWYQSRCGENPRYLSDAWVSVQLALACVVISLTIALPAAFALGRGRFRVAGNGWRRG